MNFLKKLFGQRPSPEKATRPAARQDFWSWFKDNASSFHTIIKSKTDVDEKFLALVIPKLREANADFSCQVGMFDENTAELVVTADGSIKDFVFVEEFVAAAPKVPGWIFTALSGANTMTVRIHGLNFSIDNLHFFETPDEAYPDDIMLTFVHPDHVEDNKDNVRQGIFIFLDNYLGELNAATLIDDLEVSGPSVTHPPLIPVEKLKDFLIWKEKEFVEKYSSRWFNSEDDQHSVLDGQDEEGYPMVAIINQDLLEWDGKAAYPWMIPVEFEFGLENNGMPDKTTFARITKLEDGLEARLSAEKIGLKLGAETYKGVRTAYFACREFRESSKLVSQAIKSFPDHPTIGYTIYKDKYWRTMNKFRQDFSE